jgi:hypothetical protein
MHDAPPRFCLPERLDDAVQDELSARPHGRYQKILIAQRPHAEWH